MSPLPTIRAKVSRFSVAFKTDHRTRPFVVAGRLGLAPFVETPKLIVIGAQKAGTTALHNLLSRHPQLASSFIKETAFFTFCPDRSALWYRAYFPAPRPGMLNFEASPDYIFMPWIPAAVASVAPDALIVAIVRDPVRRAQSHWAMNRSRGREHMSFIDALRAEDARLAHGAGLPRTPEAFRYSHYSYRRRGHYSEQLQRWLECFPRDQLLLLSNDALANEQNDTLRLVTDKLGIEPLQPIEKTRKNTRHYEPMDVEARALLEAEFAHEHDRLVELCGGGPYW